MHSCSYLDSQAKNTDATFTYIFCEKAYNDFLKNELEDKKDCEEKDRHRLFEIIRNMVNCDETFVICNTCGVIYNSSKYSELHVYHNAFPIKEQFAFTKQDGDTIDKDKSLVEVFHDLQRYCGISDSILMPLIDNKKSCNEEYHKQNEKIDYLHTKLQLQRQNIFKIRIYEEVLLKDLDVSKTKRADIQLAYNAQKKRMFNARMNDAKNLWCMLHDYVGEMIKMSLCDADQLYVSNQFCDMKHEFKTFERIKNILTDLKKDEEIINRQTNVEQAE